MIRLTALILIAAAGMASAQTSLPEPEGFHGEPYRSTVPATLAGAQVIDTDAALRLYDRGVPFVDVMPRKKRPEGLPEGTIWNAAPHQTIPGADWAYDTGYERISGAEQERLAEALSRATKGDKTAPVVLFCRTDCWMSWNAGKRAVQMGYSGVIWYPEGSDGWQAVGRNLVPADAE